jgi:hypothetical protein
MVVLAIVGLMVLVAAAAGQSDCSGNVGDYEYDLTELAKRIGGVDLQATDPAGNTYYYRVCGVVGDNFCQTVDGLMPAVCQKDASIPPAYHGCGDRSTAWFGRLPGVATQGAVIVGLAGVTPAAATTTREIATTTTTTTT